MNQPAPHVLVRFGSFGTLFRCRSVADFEPRRGQRVVCRTPRGLEIGEVTTTVSVADEPEGTVVRRTTPEDELLVDRLEKYRIRAVVRCQQLLAESNTETTLLEVDPLFDGKTLIFFFLGPIDDTVQELSDRLTSEYEKKVHSKHFAKLLAEGCGPGCGSKEGSGCSGGCAVCVAATACQS